MANLFQFFRIFIIFPLFLFILSGCNIQQAKRDVPGGVVLSLSPADGSYQVGDFFSVDIMLDTQGNSIEGVDLNAVNFDPDTVEVYEAVPGVLMPSTLINTFDNVNGKIKFSQVISIGNTYQNQSPQVLLTLRLRGVAPGSSRITFDHVPGSTTDSNVASQGKDILESVQNAAYQITP